MYVAYFLFFWDTFQAEADPLKQILFLFYHSDCTYTQSVY